MTCVSCVFSLSLLSPTSSGRLTSVKLFKSAEHWFFFFCWFVLLAGRRPLSVVTSRAVTVRVAAGPSASTVWPVRRLGTPLPPSITRALQPWLGQGLRWGADDETTSTAQGESTVTRETSVPTICHARDVYVASRRLNSDSGADLLSICPATYSEGPNMRV
jgi:hypothetical protein